MSPVLFKEWCQKEVQGGFCCFLAVWANTIKLSPLKHSASSVFGYVYRNSLWVVTFINIWQNPVLQERPLPPSISFGFRKKIQSENQIVSWPFPFLLGKVKCLIVWNILDVHWSFPDCFGYCCETELVPQTSHFFHALLKHQKIGLKKFILLFFYMFL